MSRRSPRSVLRGQKPRRDKRRAGVRRWLKPMLVITALLASAALFRAAWNGVPRLLSGGAAPVDWRIELKLSGDRSLDEKLAEEVLTAARSGLGRGIEPDLDRAAEAVLRLDAFSRVHVLKRSKQSIVVNIKLRRPVLCIDADRRRLVSDEGDVYGEAPSGDPDACPGPILSGVLDQPGLRHATRGDQALSLSRDDQVVVREAVALWKGAKAEGLALATINFQKHRGFSASLRGELVDGLDVTIGRAPFDAKLAKLGDILAKLKQRGEQAQRIELDYHGKAFVKLKKM